MHPYILQYGSFKISSYGLFLGIALMVGVWLAKKIGQRQGVSPQKVDSISFWLILSGILGSRFLYTFVEHWDVYGSDPLRFFRFHEGGLSFSGGLVFAVLGAIAYCKKHGISFWKMADILSPSLALGFSIAKIGCFMMGCCHGKQCDLPWGVVYTRQDSLANPLGVPLHPSQIYESIATLAIFAILYRITPKKKFDGQVFLSFLILYGVVRSLLESFRGEVGHLGILTTAQAINLPLILGALAAWKILRTRSDRSQT